VSVPLQDPAKGTTNVVVVVDDEDVGHLDLRGT
jgi:hypothetical protein